MYSRFASIEDLDILQDKQQERIRAEPTSATERFRLFQVLSMRGRWEDAKRQLQQALNNDASLLPMIRSYQHIIDAEQQRDRCWRGGAPVKLAGHAIEDWATHLAANCTRLDDPECLASNLAGAPAVRGEIDVVREGTQDIQTHEFQWIADGDCRLGPMLELIGAQGYSWMPLTQLREIEIAAPQSGVDRLWARAVLTLASGERQRTTIPVRYTGDYASLSSALLLGRKTCWQALGDESLQLFTGAGQRMWITDLDEYALLDIRAVRLLGSVA
jgi:type VI secretion system protein ImpE